MRQKTLFIAILLSVLLVTPALVIGQGSGPRRVRPPEWSQEETRDVFFDNAFEEGLVGERPADLGRSGAGTASGTSPPLTTDSGIAWSQIISTATLEDEVKAAKARIDQLITTPGRFAAQDYQAARREFSLLAMLMGIAAQYDGQVRWQPDAAAARDLFSRTAASCQVGTSQVFQESRRRQADLQDLVGGGRLQSEPEGAETAEDWGQVVDRVPLMQKLESIQDALLPDTANAGRFAANREEVRRGAELAAAIATVLGQEGMDDVGDQEYEAFCRQLQEAALSIVEAAKQQDAGQASQATGEMTQSCSACHDFYRG